MDQDSVVVDQVDAGKRLMAALEAKGFEIRLAFWAKPSDEGKWYLYLASPFVSQKGPLEAYRFVLEVIGNLPDLWIDFFDIKVLGLDDSLTKAGMALMKPKVSSDPFAVKPPKPFPGMTRFNGSNLGGLSVDGATFYPLSERSVSA
jgi:hypothetical protein